MYFSYFASAYLWNTLLALFANVLDDPTFKQNNQLPFFYENKQLNYSSVLGYISKVSLGATKHILPLLVSLQDATQFLQFYSQQNI